MGSVGHSQEGPPAPVRQVRGAGHGDSIAYAGQPSVVGRHVSMPPPTLQRLLPNSQVPEQSESAAGASAPVASSASADPSLPPVSAESFETVSPKSKLTAPSSTVVSDVEASNCF